MTHHLCIHKAYATFDGDTLPYGGDMIEEKLTEVINSLLDDIIFKIKDDEEVIVCGDSTVKRMVARKLEDRLKREVKYE